MKIADRLGKMKWEIEQEMPISELYRWAEYLELENKRIKKEAKKQDNVFVTYPLK